MIHLISRVLPRALPTSLVLCLGSGCVEQSPDTPNDEDVKAAKEHILTTAPTPKFPSKALLSAPSGRGKIKYLGLDVDTDSVSVGKSFTLTHYLQVEEPATEGWRFFVHLDTPLDKKGHLNADHVPISGKYPVPMWKKGEIIRDIHKVSLPGGWQSDKLFIYTGIWKGSARYKVEGGESEGNRLLAATLPVTGAQAAPSVSPASPTEAPSGKRLIARKIPPGGKLTIDGKLDEAMWKEAQSTGPFVQTMTGAPVEQQGEARVLWDDENVYIAFEFADKDVWTSLEKHDDKLWTQEVAEVFIDADGDGKSYIELQVNPKNTTFDSYLPGYRQNDNAWDAPMQTAVSVSGTLDKRDDTDKGWTVEMKIPMSAVRGKQETVKGVPATIGTEWRVNFFRFDMPAGKAQIASGWSPPLRPDFHALDRFGVLAFGNEQGQVLVQPGKGGPGPHEAGPLLKKLMVNPLAQPPADAQTAKTKAQREKAVAPLLKDKDKPAAK